MDNRSASTASSRNLEVLLQKECRIATVRDFQLTHGLDLIYGNDLFLVAAPGLGKTIVMAAPWIYAQSAGENGIALVVVPSKILTEQQAYVFRSYNLFALAINQDTLRNALYDKIDLIKEIAGRTGIRIAVVTPWMLKNDYLQDILCQGKIRSQIRWCIIDEIHLANKKDPSVWLEPYRAILHMRDRLPSRTIWAGMTGTATPTETIDIARSLGFRNFVNARHTVDRKNVKFIPRFLEHAVSGTQFLDLSFLIPLSFTSPSEIERTLVFCETIEQGHRVQLFLDSLIPSTITNHSRLVMPCNGLMNLEERNQFKAAMDSGSIRIGVVTDACTYGYNISATRVVTLTLSHSPVYSKLYQQWGRVSRDGSAGLVYAFVPSWLRIVPKEMVVKKSQQEEATRRKNVPQVVLDFFNATPTTCPRDVHLAYNCEALGDRPNPCCSIHHPEPETSLNKAAVAVWSRRLTIPPRAKVSMPRSDGTYPPLEAHQKPFLRRTLEHYRIKRWKVLRPPTSDMPSFKFLSDAQISRLLDRAHASITTDNLRPVLAPWAYFETEGQALVDLLIVALEGIKAIVNERDMGATAAELASDSAPVVFESPTSAKHDRNTPTTISEAPVPQTTVRRVILTMGTRSEHQAAATPNGGGDSGAHSKSDTISLTHKRRKINGEDSITGRRNGNSEVKHEQPEAVAGPSRRGRRGRGRGRGCGSLNGRD